MPLTPPPPPRWSWPCSIYVVGRDAFNTSDTRRFKFNILEHSFLSSSSTSWSTPSCFVPTPRPFALLHTLLCFLLSVSIQHPSCRRLRLNVQVLIFLFHCVSFVQRWYIWCNVTAGRSCTVRRSLCYGDATRVLLVSEKFSRGDCALVG